MKIGVISDTHGYLDDAVRTHFAGVDCIFHLGDIGAREVLDKLGALAPLRVIRGNHEPSDLMVLPLHLKITLNGLRIACYHGFISTPFREAERMFGAYLRELVRDCDLILFGHTHQKMHFVRDGLHLVNPGYSGPPGDGRERSVAIVETSNGAIACRHIVL